MNIMIELYSIKFRFRILGYTTNICYCVETLLETMLYRSSYVTLKHVDVPTWQYMAVHGGTWKKNSERGAIVPENR